MSRTMIRCRANDGSINKTNRLIFKACTGCPKAGVES
jgi:hypothetical protein